MIVALIAKVGQDHTGVGRYTNELARALLAQGHQVVLVRPSVPLPGWLVGAFHRWLDWDLASFFQNYPIWVRYPQADVYHITSQNLATLMLFRRPPGGTVITVHDILPHLLRNDTTVTNFHHDADRIFNRLAMWGLRRARTLLAVSQYSAQTLIDHFDIVPDRIFVTWEGVTSSNPLVLARGEEGA